MCIDSDFWIFREIGISNMKCVIPGVNIKGNEIVHFLKSYLYHMITKINNCDDLKNGNN